MAAHSASRLTIPALDYTGERMVPEVSGEETFWGHVYRYAFACRFIEAKRVLDIACGEGYGSAALLKAGAASVIGVDVSEEVCRHARAKYGIDARHGSAEKIPLPDASVDIIISFETIEHLTNPFRFLDECTRVLTHSGWLVISTPNKGVYKTASEEQNPFHFSEMTEAEFSSALRARFRRVKMYSQHPRFAPRWSLSALAADATPWRGNEVFERIRRSAHFRFAPHTVAELTPADRSGVVEEVLKARKMQRPLANQYGLAPRHKWSRTKPTYFVAIAERPCQK